ncbi:hypothetical protein OF83DRAFT_1135047 [Amylostereum chailletii]|nr:hypothetical protein OF83DRAFT_1135047 [Amylostereum chailletii]
MPVFRVGRPGEEAPKETIPTRKEDSEVEEERSHRADKDDDKYRKQPSVLIFLTRWISRRTKET